MIHDSYLYVSGLFTDQHSEVRLNQRTDRHFVGNHRRWISPGFSRGPGRERISGRHLGFCERGWKYFPLCVGRNVSEHVCLAEREWIYRSDRVRGRADSPRLIGDFNNDGVVDAADYVVWRNASPTATLPNDRTPGVVDASDYADWRANFGKSQPASGAALGGNAVPEPASILLLFIAIMGGSTFRNRN